MCEFEILKVILKWRKLAQKLGDKIQGNKNRSK